MNKGVFLFIYLFFWMFPPVLKLSGFILKTNYFFVILSGLMFFLFHSRFFLRSGVVKLTLIFLMIGFLYTVAITFASLLFLGVVDFSFLKDYLAGFFVLFSAGFISYSYALIYNDKCIEKLMLHLFMAGALHSFLILTIVLFEPFKELFYSIIWVTEKQERYLFGDVFNARVSGFLDTGFSSLSTTHALIFCVGFIYTFGLKIKFSFLQYFLYFICMFLIFLSLIFIGRTGILIIVLFSFSYILFFGGKRVIRLKISKILFRSMAYFFFFLLFILIVIGNIVNIDDYKNEIGSSFELFLNFANHGGLSTTSTDIILNEMLIFPDNGIGLLLGELNYGRGSTPILSDLGVVYILNGAGFIGLLIMWSFYIPFFLGVMSKIKYVRFHSFSFLALFFLILTIVLNFKDLYFLSFAGFTKIFFLFLFFLHLINSREKVFGRIL
jgi:hypothetical protein